MQLEAHYAGFLTNASHPCFDRSEILSTKWEPESEDEVTRIRLLHEPGFLEVQSSVE